ncbi:MAG: hypothetical protein WC998_03390 [Candidatus Paceibacterota bacterium]|jgi:hypothetical protein
MSSQEKDDNQIWLEWKQKQDAEVDAAMSDPKNIRYYLGKYKVYLMPNQPKNCAVLGKNYRHIVAAESFPDDRVKMMVNEREQFSTSWRWLYIKRKAEV